MSSTSLPHRRPLRALCLLTVVTAAVLSGCTNDGKPAHDGPTSAPPTSAPPRGVVTRAEADMILDTYQDVNNRANATRDAKLLATVEAGQLYARSKADYEQFATLSAKDKKQAGEPFTFTQRSFLIPATGNWFAAEASTTGKNHTVMVFEKSADTGDTWKKVISLFPQRALPAPTTKDGLAEPADANSPVGLLAPANVTDAVEDLFATGGTKDGSKLSHTNDSAKNILTTYKERGDTLGSQATVNFFPVTPLHQKVYTLRTDTGVLVIAPLAHKQESLVKNSGLQITPGKTESVYNRTPRALVADQFQGETVVHLPLQGKPEILDYRYAMVDSR
ncbi:hypothetical protein [Streptomyces sp. NBC_00582]|uniref:hypothetical protein n=1 Tax=Streptomyces sp. NBC_00582 TaxID=2975783 RepID=UPI002E81FC90|nr:hypothetical protein [Streptomyces sp. NBC_00582]WUB68350.1 hypothetical protein OG852_49460 [Streptomyces sp. NBC_00582]